MKTAHVNKDSYDVYIGRGSMWGNPFHIRKSVKRHDVIFKYEKYLQNEIAWGKITRFDLESLFGQTLGCYCAPAACHGNVLMLYAYRATYAWKSSENSSGLSLLGDYELPDAWNQFLWARNSYLSQISDIAGYVDVLLYKTKELEHFEKGNE